LVNVQHTDVPTTSTFDSSEPLFDAVGEAVVNTMRNSFHHRSWAFVAR
jgi:hypothetical protein